LGTRDRRAGDRAELEAETRLRITQAAVDLRGSVGPALTTISAVADRAGVQRATVYRHFPTRRRYSVPARRTGWRLALRELYEWYEDGAYMIEKSTDITGHSSGRVMWWIPNTYQSTTSVSSIERFCAVQAGSPRSCSL
jgi:AcrR family transcriptional regulator